MSNLSLYKRLFIFHKTLQLIDYYFVYRENLDGGNTDHLYNKYIDEVIKTGNNYKFSLLMKRVLAELKNSHCFYFDKNVYPKHGTNLGFYAFYHDHKKCWIVSKTKTDGVSAGDIVKKIDDEPVEKFFSRKKQYISASSDRDARNRLFFIFGMFNAGNKIKFDNGTSVTVKNTESVFEEAPSHTLLHDKIPYISIPSFDMKYHKKIYRYIKRYFSYDNLIIDLRDNSGGSTPKYLIKLLMDKKYRDPLYTVIYHRDAFWNINHYTHPGEYALKKTTQNYKLPAKYHYTGNILILVNEITISAGEDFLIPFKDNGRAIIIGSKTAGSDGDFYGYTFKGGISVGIGAVKVEYPDGSHFEGEGIEPDIPIYTSQKDLKEGKDTVLSKAIKIIES